MQQSSIVFANIRPDMTLRGAKIKELTNHQCTCTTTNVGKRLHTLTFHTALEVSAEERPQNMQTNNRQAQ